MEQERLTTDSRLSIPKSSFSEEPDHHLPPRSPLTLELATPLERDLRQRYEITHENFQDNGSDHCDFHEYSRPGGDQGLVIIFNQEFFDIDLPKRAGTSKDEANLRETFLKLGFNVKMQTIHRDFGRRQIQDVCKMYAENYETEHSNSLIVIFMSHGDKNNVLYTRDGHIEVMDVIQPLSVPFKNKPKMFIFQACKGTVDDIKTNMIQHETNELIFPIYNLPSDTIIYYSTVEGNVSIRDFIDGTWLISELCKNFLMYGRREDIISLLQRTTKCVSIYQTYLKDEKIHYKQMPVIVSTLQKKFYLSSNKYRENMHISNNNIKEAANSLNKLVQQFK
ncbi:caspase-6-like [Onthophagus taurus]|uniref:caspase-6-like n=1 Tax=Onthophagus taurus TaxID=166361 RepID=UPI0039BE24B7